MDVLPHSQYLTFMLGLPAWADTVVIFRTPENPKTEAVEHGYWLLYLQSTV